MGNLYASGKNAKAICDVCGFTYKLPELKKLTVRGAVTEIKACPACWTPDQPQNNLGKFPVYDPQALRDPRSDRNTWAASRAIIVPVVGVHSAAVAGYPDGVLSWDPPTPVALYYEVETAPTPVSLQYEP